MVQRRKRKIEILKKMSELKCVPSQSILSTGNVAQDEFAVLSLTAKLLCSSHCLYVSTFFQESAMKTSTLFE